MKTLIIVPAFNEELTVGSIVALASKYGDVLVIDDGSKDRTAEIAKRIGARVLRHTRNIGKGAALVNGFKHALQNGYDVVVCIDADGQHDPDEIPRLLEPINRGKADIVIGSRYLSNSKVPFYRRMGLILINFIMRLIAPGTKVRDTQSGLRAFKVSILRDLEVSSLGYETESEILIKALEKGYRVIEIPANIKYNVPKGHKIGALSHGLIIIKHLINILSYNRPLLFFGTLGLTCLFIASVLAMWALEPYPTMRRIYLTQMVGAGIFTVLGIQLLTTGLILNYLNIQRKILKE